MRAIKNPTCTFFSEYARPCSADQARLFLLWFFFNDHRLCFNRFNDWPFESKSGGCRRVGFQGDNHLVHPIREGCVVEIDHADFTDLENEGVFRAVRQVEMPPVVLVAQSCLAVYFL